MSFAFVFPGQGSQSVGMMAAYGDAAIVRATFDEASATLGDDLWAMVADGPAETLIQTVNTQPVMLTAGVAAWRLWLEKGGRKPLVVAGHSLGEYSALVAAGVIDFRDAVPLVRLRAAAMQEAVPFGTGANDAAGQLAEFKKMGFKGVFSIEYEVGGPELQDNVAKCVQWFSDQAGKLAK